MVRMTRTNEIVDRIDIELVQRYLPRYAAGGLTDGALERARARARHSSRQRERDQARRERQAYRNTAAIAADLTELWGAYRGPRRVREQVEQDDEWEPRRRVRRRLEEAEARVAEAEHQEQVERQEQADREGPWTARSDEGAESERSWGEGPSAFGDPRGERDLQG